MTLENRPSFTVKMAVSDRNDGTRGPQLALGSVQGQVGAACSTTGLGLVCGLTSSERRATQRPERPKARFWEVRPHSAGGNRYSN